MSFNRKGRPHSLPTFADTNGARGFYAVYRHNEVNHCPSCGRTHWYVGRFSAECGFCSTALPLANKQ